jgi:hypothetical protein
MRGGHSQRRRNLEGDSLTLGERSATGTSRHGDLAPGVCLRPTYPLPGYCREQRAGARRSGRSRDRPFMRACYVIAAVFVLTAALI